MKVQAKEEECNTFTVVSDCIVQGNSMMLYDLTFLLIQEVLLGRAPYHLRPWTTIMASLLLLLLMLRALIGPTSRYERNNNTV